ncbi:hypothetical protein [Nucisporomicrobium flavum]|uniref:hypothetical protein n=1 Tax=Nucisporomicrobium flavum TaxID=2785915 RepID=UPI0018F7AC4D|nr:hypothetical protein [Nucisporomicrobium flavum]
MTATVLPLLTDPRTTAATSVGGLPTIIGADLRLVEIVTGRLTVARAAPLLHLSTPATLTAAAALIGDAPAPPAPSRWRNP